MKTSELVILGVLGYLFLKSRTPQGQYAPGTMGPFLPGPDMNPGGVNVGPYDPCNGLSPTYSPNDCLASGRQVYYPAG